MSLKSSNETISLSSAVENSDSKIFYEYTKKAESKIKKIKIISVPDNGIILYNKPMVGVKN